MLEKTSISSRKNYATQPRTTQRNDGTSKTQDTVVRSGPRLATKVLFGLGAASHLLGALARTPGSMLGTHSAMVPPATPQPDALTTALRGLNQGIYTGATPVPSPEAEVQVSVYHGAKPNISAPPPVVLTDLSAPPPVADAASPAVSGPLPNAGWDVSYNGGPLISNAQINAVFLGNNPNRPQIQNFLGNLTQSDFYASMQQYAVPGFPIHPPTFRGAVQGPALTNYTEDSTLQTILTGMLQAGTVPANDANQLYVLYGPPGVLIDAPDQDGDCTAGVFGYHYNFQIQDGSQVHYAVVPFPCNQSLAELAAIDRQTAITSHEVAESVTDPEPNSAWSGPFGEIADDCRLARWRLNGFMVQSYWSNQDGACMPNHLVPDQGNVPPVTNKRRLMSVSPARLSLALPSRRSATPPATSRET